MTQDKPQYIKGNNAEITTETHRVLVKELDNGELIINILPDNLIMTDYTSISHCVEEDIIRIATSRNLRTDSQSVCIMKTMC